MRLWNSADLMRTVLVEARPILSDDMARMVEDAMADMRAAVEWMSAIEYQADQVA